ncbi:MAG: IS1595 family transposase [Candidatus Aminicenantes bacterium]|nr:IS1595 family transposase [Candidatus Aminicenantes bacterium]
MNIIEIYEKYPDHIDCLKHLEMVRWNGKSICPYCKSIKVTAFKSEYRYHCNNCNTSFSVTVGTIFHKTKLDLQKWFLAVSLVLNAKKKISARKLARDIKVNKNTAWYMQMRIRRAMVQNSELLSGIIEVDETYVGDKDKNEHSNKKTGGTQGRNTKGKIVVVGVLKRDGEVKAQRVKDVSAKSQKGVIRKFVEKNSNAITDSWRGYIGISADFKHRVIFHSLGENVNGNDHVNTLEGFWNLLKRGILGQYHKIVKNIYRNMWMNFVSVITIETIA